MATKLLRYVDVHGVVLLNWYPVIRTTPQGQWIEDNSTWPVKKRFVLNNGTKRFAHETEKDAKVSFLARKKSQLGYLRAQTNNVEVAVKAMQEDRINDRADCTVFEL